MKSDRKRLKAEKVDLLHQMKQLYITLEDKESELRDFIRNYEQRVQESDESIKQVRRQVVRGETLLRVGKCRCLYDVCFGWQSIILVS